MTFQWDAANIEHIVRHSVTPDEVQESFQNEAIELTSYHRNGEERRALAGITDAGRVLFVVYTLTGRQIRVITAHESRKYRPFF